MLCPTLHVTLITFRDGIDVAATMNALEKLVSPLPDASLLWPQDAEAKRSWHGCLQVRSPSRGALEVTLSSSAWNAVMELVSQRAEVQKSWSFGLRSSTEAS